ncbi:unnamed protein product [Sphenostylis stenocarpa]|uniref:Uncharacterized protein n=1 Tax=Sphenostylis stenocarpa TaxID=92480 RepID=A0AA86SUA2_9FABA|nr:unnamed protein product [Sphenostylis stenocarpa]
MEAEEEQRRRLKLEEALEIQSLRRIISAYLNYPDAAEEDVRRYERSYRKLPPAHKTCYELLIVIFLWDYTVISGLALPKLEQDGYTVAISDCMD